jgi:hypothetical protein
MPHIVELYAKDLGVKTGKPDFSVHFIPIGEDKYITLHVDSEIEAKQYPFWDIAIALIKPELDKLGIKIYQVGRPNTPTVTGVDKNYSGCTYRNSNYVLKNSILHLGIDSLPVHVSSSYGKKIVALYSHTWPSTCSPYWTNDSDCILLQPDFSEIKPSFSTQENPKRINEIYPEEVAQAVLDLLEIDHNVTFKTINVGHRFKDPIIEIIPDYFQPFNNQNNFIVNIRADYHFHLANIHQWVTHYPCNIVTDRKIDLHYLTSNVKQIMFRLIKLGELDENYLRAIKQKHINPLIVCDNPDILSEMRLEYLDFTVSPAAKHDKIEDLPENTKFFSNKNVLKNNQTFGSMFAALEGDTSGKFVQNDHSLEELDSLYLYTKI